MLAMEEQNKKERLSFFVSGELSDKLNSITQKQNQTVSDFIRNALISYIAQVEKERIDRELEEGYKANYDYYLKSAEDWKNADKE